METTKSTCVVSYFIQRTKINQSTGLAPIIGRITVNREKVHFSTRMHIASDRWLTEPGKTMGRNVTEQKINETLDAFRAAIMNKYNQKIILGLPITSTSLRDKVFNAGKENKADKEVKLNTVMLVEHHQNVNDKYKELVKLGKKTNRSWCRYDQLLRKVVEFMETEYKISNILLHEITTEFFDDFFLWLRKVNPDQKHNYHMKMTQRLGTVYRKEKPLSEPPGFMLFSVPARSFSSNPDIFASSLIPKKTSINGHFGNACFRMGGKFSA